MSRTIDEIYQQIQDEKNSMSYIHDKLTNENGTTTISTEQNLLNDLQSNNKVAIWKLWSFLTALEINFMEQNWDEFKTELEDIKASAIVGSRKWWVEKCLEWQFGDVVEINPDTYQIYYSIIDESLQLIKHATVSEIGGKVVLKVQKEYGTGLLSIPELNSFESYVSKVKFAGTRTNIWNFNPDTLKLYYTIYYDPLVDETTVQSNVESTINDYIQNLPFDSEFNKTDLTNKLQLIDGVIDPIFISGEGKAEGSGAYVAFDNYYTSTAGFCEIDSVFPLSSTITYTKKIK